jgi:hypothetical protein
MSTEIKNTLFRFVTMRAPELSNEKNQERRFLKQPQSESESSFSKAVKIREKNVTKWNAMKKNATTFPAIQSNDELRTMNLELYGFAIWIARNKFSYDEKELLLEKGKVINNLTPAQVNLLWDNLFYQVVTHKNFYVKETIIQLLVADNLTKNFVINDSEAIADLTRAKVVLPKTLFIEDDTPVSVSTENTKSRIASLEDKASMSIPSETMKQNQAIIVAEFEIDRITKLKAELVNAEKQYKKNFQIAYAKAQDKHQKLVKPKLDRYSKAVEESKRNWCSIQNPQIPYNPIDPCSQPPLVPAPTLPKFEFEFKNEIDVNHLQSNISYDNYNTLVELFGIEEYEDKTQGDVSTLAKSELNSNARMSPLFNISNYDSYSGLHATLDTLLAENNQIIINSTPSQAPKAISIGGVIIPTSNVLAAIPFTYQICPINMGARGINFSISIEVPDNSWQITSLYYTMKKTTGNATNGTYTSSRTNNTIFIKNLVGENIWSEVYVTGFEMVLSFSNGSQKKFNVEGFNFKTCFSGVLTDLNVIIPDETTNTVEANFIPKGYGVKQLGIADYKKVEQTIQGYVEGEVAHIENIMAREYKEKSTRRLRRSENTTSTSSESEREQLSDTTSTSRFEIQSEIASVLQESKDFSAGVNTNAEFTYGAKFSIGANVNFATHSSKEESNRQAVSQAKDITERAMERVVTKIKQERIEKIIEEFEENNKHGFDNTKGDKHVVGVFRWVDKVYKNQVINYGKRLMFEFMIPEPSKLHVLGMKENSMGKKIDMPDDPRAYKDSDTAIIKFNLMDYSLINEHTVKFWSSKFNVVLKQMPALNKTIGKSFSSSTIASGGYHDGQETFDAKETLLLPEGYYTKEASVSWAAVSDNDGSQQHGTHVGVGNLRFTNRYAPFPIPDEQTPRVIPTLKKFVGEIPLSVYYLNNFVFNAQVSIELERTPELYTQWQHETFNAIIEGYKDAVVEYNQALAEENANGIKIKGTNPGFYRQIENMVLRKNCISYIIDQNPKGKRTYGKKIGDGNTFGTYEIQPTAELDDYTSFVKFIEQAFEWDIMSYNFYPYYWGNRDNWAQLYQYDDNDPLFRSFMQSGMARVIVTVRPGFEEAVSYYMQTGQIWNGGEVPVIEDKLFLSIIDELRQAPGKKEGKAWATRLPTALTILQADSIGLKVTKALPYDEDLSDYENPSDVPRPTGFQITGSQLNANTTKFIEFTFQGMDNRVFRTIGEHDTANQFPRIYECMGQTITINRNAKWQKTTSSSVIFDELTDQLSLLNGIKAKISVSENGATDGITFTVDTSKIKDFTFKKPGNDPLYDSLRVIVEDESIVKIGQYFYQDGRIQDKSGVALDLSNTFTLFPISRFEI